MSPNPSPLPADWVLNERFVVRRVLGRGGFGIAYLCDDLTRHDSVVVKELAPLGAVRGPDGVLDLDSQHGSGHALRHRFLDEAGVLRRFNHPGIPLLRSAFSENGTAYHVTSYLPRAKTLEERLRREGSLSEEDALELFVSMLDVLEVVHAAGVLHRDIKPSNILLGSNGEIVLIDFGAARDWVAEVANTHTVMHTPGYAPPEQMSERAVRGPGTDLYGLCATVYHALTRRPPSTASERLAGLPLIPVLELCPTLDPAFAIAIEAGLEPRLDARPPDVHAMRMMLRDPGPASSDLDTIAQIDDTLVRLAAFRFDKRACPNCDGLLREPRPLRNGACPVCREGLIRARRLDESKCPVCRIGRMERLENTELPAICPDCRRGRLTYRRKGLFAADKIADCDHCQARFEVFASEMKLGEETAPIETWLARSGRSSEVWDCASCEASFDVLPDGRWQQYLPVSAKPQIYYPEEWARIAAGLRPSAGNAQCDVCSADYWREDERLILLDAPRDPFGFAGHYTGRSLSNEDVRWLGAGKASGLPGLICDSCPTEFDRDGDFFRLSTSPNREMTLHLGEPKVLEDWHRIAQVLPTIDELPSFEDSIESILRNAFRSGALSFDDQGTIWRGKAVQNGSSSEGLLTVTSAEIVFGRTFRKWRIPADALIRVEAEDNTLILFVSGQAEAVEFDLLPVELVAHLRSGDRAFDVTAEDLVERLTGAPVPEGNDG